MDGQGDPKKRARSVKLSGRADKCLSPSNCTIYICLNLRNLFVLNCKMYLSQSAKCICLKLQDLKKRARSVKLSGRADKCLSPSNCKIYLSQFTKFICPKLQNIFVSNCKMCLSQIAKCICLKLQKVFDPKC